MKEDVKTIVLTKDESEELADLIHEHISKIGKDIFYGDKNDNDSMKRFFTNIYEKIV